MKLAVLLSLGLTSMVAAADVLLVSTAEPELTFIRVTAMKPFHARYKVIVFAKGAPAARSRLDSC